MIKNIIISGGAVRTISVIGALKYLDEQTLLQNVDTFVGTSAGSILCFFVCIGYTIDEIVHFLHEHLFGNNLYSLSLDEVINFNILTAFGMDSGSTIIQLFEDALFLKYHRKDITFIELTKMTAKNLVVCAANITSGESEYFSVDTTPDVSVILALRMSISLPFIFSPVKHNNCYYVDGGIFESFPLSYVNRYKDHLKDTLGIYTLTSELTTQHNKIESMLDYVSAIFTSTIRKANDLTTQKISDKIKVINIEFDTVDIASFDFESLSFNINSSIIDEYIGKGYETIKKCFLTQNA